MTKLTDVLTPERRDPVFIADFSTPRSGQARDLDDAAGLPADFICVAYNPGKAVRADSVAAAAHIKRETGTETIFNLSPRDMNKLALESRLLGAQLLGLENLLIVQGDPMTERDGSTAVKDYTATGLIAAVRSLNAGVDHKGSKLRAPTDFCIGASLDLDKGVGREARLAQSKVSAGAHYLMTQAIFDVALIEQFREAYALTAGEQLTLPVAWGLQILAKEGVVFSNVPDAIRTQLEQGRDGVEIALESYERLRAAGVAGIYLVSPIMRGGARDYAAGRRFLESLGRG